MAAYRNRFFNHTWNVLDFVIVGFDIISVALNAFDSVVEMPKLSMMRGIRVFRLARVFKALAMFPELALLANGFVHALKAMFWCIMMIVVVITVWAVLAVQLINPINMRVADSGYYKRTGCERCPRAFESVFESALSIFQALVAGDSWGTLALPIIEAEPVSLLFFLLVLVTISLAIMNLILAVIVERAQEARQENLAEIAEQRESDFKQAAEKLQAIFDEADSDGSGTISKEEFVNASMNVPEFVEMLEILGLHKRDLSMFFDALDEDHSGGVHYHEFARQSYKMRNPNLNMLIIELMGLKQSMKRIEQMVVQSDATSATASGFEMSAKIRELDAKIEKVVKEPVKKVSGSQKQNADVITETPPDLRNLEQNLARKQVEEASAPKTRIDQVWADSIRMDSNGESAICTLDKALDELATSVKRLVIHSEVQSNIAADVESTVGSMLQSFAASTQRIHYQVPDAVGWNQSGAPKSGTAAKSAAPVLVQASLPSYCPQPPPSKATTSFCDTCLKPPSTSVSKVPPLLCEEPPTLTSNGDQLHMIPR